MNVLSFFLPTALRALTLLTKFFFSIFLVKELTTENFGDWILITTLINYFVLLFGMEFYNLTIRDYIQKNDYDSLKKLIFQWTFHIKLYLFSFVIFLFYFIFINNQILIFYLFLVLIFEHITIEFYRLSCFYGDVFFSNLILFLKSGFWMIIFFLFYNSKIDIELIILYWISGLLVTFLFCFIKHFSLVKKIWLENKKLSFKNKVINKKLFFQQLQPFFVLAIFSRAPFVFDKLFISFFNSPNDLALYGYYFNFANGVQSLFEAFFVISILPKIMKFNNSKHVKYYFKKFIYRTVVFWIFSSIVIFFLLPVIDIYINKSYSSSRLMFLILMFSQFIFSISIFYQYVLYSFRMDNCISKGAIIFFVISLLLFCILIPFYGAFGSSIAIMLSTMILLIQRFYSISKIT